MKKLLVLLVPLLVCANSHSAWTGYGTIVLINDQPAAGTGNSMTFIETSTISNPSDPTSCSERNGFYFLVDDERKERQFSMILAAHMAQKEVRFFVTDTCHQWGYAEIDGVILK